MKLVSVIMPTFNRAHCLDRAIRSVINQTYMNWELIIVDNYSVDGTDSLVSKYPDVRIRLLKVHNQGIIAVSRNKGILESRGEYIAFLDSDDWWSPHKLRKSVESLELGFDLTYHDMYIFNEDRPDKKKLKKSKTRELSVPIFDDLLVNGNAINNSSVVVRKSIIERVGGISEERDLVAKEDYDAWLRISKITERFHRLDGCYGWYSSGSDNMSSPARTEISTKRIIEIYIKNDQPTPVIMDYALSRAYYKQLSYSSARHYAAKVIFRRSSARIFVGACVTYLLACGHEFQVKLFRGRAAN